MTTQAQKSGASALKASASFPTTASLIRFPRARTLPVDYYGELI